MPKYDEIKKKYPIKKYNQAISFTAYGVLQIEMLYTYNI